MVSKSALRHQVYDSIEAVARPGDVCFFITEDCDCYNQLSRLEKFNRKWVGFLEKDITIWHVGILSKFEKKPKSSQIRPYIIHSTKDKGVFEQHISPEYFTSKNISGEGASCRTIMEILRDEDLSEDQTCNVVEFCRSQIGKPFPKNLHSESLTYIFGLPNWGHDPNMYSCHWLLYAAFCSVGVDFPHHLETAPFWNIARGLGHPLGHRREKMNPKFPYLRDHHFYRDPRFKCVLSLTYDVNGNQINIAENPGKFSWRPELAAGYHVNS